MVVPAPNLVDEGNGLLGTHVTWEIVERAVQKTFDTVAIFGPEKKAINLADGVGFSSKIALVTADWQNEDKGLPEKFIVKMATCLNGKQLLKSTRGELGDQFDLYFIKWSNLMRGIHNTEVEFFEYMKDVPCEDKEGTMLPKVFYTKRFDSDDDVIGFLIMEYIEDVDAFHLHNNLEVEQLKQVLSSMARLQAISLTSSYRSQEDLNRHHVREFHDHLLPATRFKEIIGQMKLFGDAHFHQLIDNALLIFDDVYDTKVLEKECEREGMTPVFVHGDLWAANLLWRKGTNQLKNLIDFQLCSLGSPSYDLCRLFITCLSSKERRESEFLLIEYYHDELTKAVKEGQMPFTLQQLKSSYQHLFPFCALANTAMFGPVLAMAVAKITDPVENLRIMTNIQDKMGAMFEDLLKYYRMNKDSQEKLNC